MYIYGKTKVAIFLCILQIYSMLSGACCDQQAPERMSSDFYSSDGLLETGSIPLDIDNVHMVLQGQSIFAYNKHFDCLFKLKVYMAIQLKQSFYYECSSITYKDA